MYIILTNIIGCAGMTYPFDNVSIVIKIII